MPRAILDEAHIHPAIRETIATNRREIVEAVQAAIAQHDLVIVGMGINPVPKKAKKLLDARKIAYHYMTYGSYFSEWRRRNALKMWTGWPTFPMVFHKGIFIGGAADLGKLLESGEIA